MLTKTTVYLDPDTVLALRRMAETQGRSQAELIRDAVETYTRNPNGPSFPASASSIAATRILPNAPKRSWSALPNAADGADRRFRRARDLHHSAVARVIARETGAIIVPMAILAEIDYLLRVRLGNRAVARDLGLGGAAVIAAAERQGLRQILTVEVRDFRAVQSSEG